MDYEEIRRRAVRAKAEVKAKVDEEQSTKPAAAYPIEYLPTKEHPSHYGPLMQGLRILLLVLYFLASCICMHLTQWAGVWLYFYNRDWYYAWMAMTKQHFTLLILSMQAWWSPTLVRVCGDKSVRGQLEQTADGRMECRFPERIVVLSNHQIYTDWLYLWWSAYAARMHGHLYIILKESLKYIPLLGPGMMFFSFIFLSRKWAEDKPRFQHRLKKLTNKHKGPGNTDVLDPMWLLLFPEGTNVSKNGREKSRAWAEKCGIPDLRHCLLPRSTGLLFCLEELGDTVEWVYDCTLTYEGVPRGQYGQDIYTLRKLYLQGLTTPSVNMHWRRFHTSTIPKEAKAFDEWLLERWREKDDLLEHYMQNGGFPADEGIDYEETKAGDGVRTGINRPVKGAGYIEVNIRTNPLEFLTMYAPAASLALCLHLIRRFWNWFLVGLGR